jgi:hypothetical protein
MVVQNDTFVLAFAAATGQVYTVQATADLASPVWTNLVGSVVGVGSVMEFVDAGATAPSRYYRVAVGACGCGSGPVYSLNVVGYVNRLMQTGTNLVANPLDTFDNTITNVLWNCPDGTVIYDSFGGSSECYGGVWAPANLSLNPGDGAILVNPSGPFVATFVGQVMQGTLVNPLPAQPMLKSSMAPVAGLWDFPAQEGDQIQTWDVTNQTFVIHKFLDGAWTDTPPTVQPGEAFWVMVSAATNWVQNFNAFGGGPPSITNQPSSQTISRGATAQFMVGATNSLPLGYQWRKDATNILDSGNIYGANTCLLVISNCLPADAGVYSVVVSNANGCSASSNATLTVVEPPALLQQPQSQSSLLGTTASFTVQADGTAPLGYQWLRYGTNLVGQTDATLTILDVQAADEAPYTVVVTNVAGAVTSSVVNLIVTLPPLTAPQITVDQTDFTFLLSGPPGSNYVLQVSTNLLNWSPVSTSTMPVSGTITLSNVISGYSRRFYRVYLQ